MKAIIFLLIAIGFFFLLNALYPSLIPTVISFLESVRRKNIAQADDVYRRMRANDIYVLIYSEVIGRYPEMNPESVFKVQESGEKSVSFFVDTAIISLTDWQTIASKVASVYGREYIGIKTHGTVVKGVLKIRW